MHDGPGLAMRDLLLCETAEWGTLLSVVSCQPQPIRRWQCNFHCSCCENQARQVNLLTATVECGRHDTSADTTSENQKAAHADHADKLLLRMRSCVLLLDTVAAMQCSCQTC